MSECHKILTFFLYELPITEKLSFKNAKFNLAQKMTKGGNEIFIQKINV